MKIRSRLAVREMERASWLDRKLRVEMEKWWSE